MLLLGGFFGQCEQDQLILFLGLQLVELDDHAGRGVFGNRIERDGFFPDIDDRPFVVLELGLDWRGDE